MKVANKLLMTSCTMYSNRVTDLDSPKKATRWRVRVAVKCGVLRSQQEGEDSSGACTKRMPDYHQPIVHGALVLGETATVITLTTAHFCYHGENNHLNKLPLLQFAELFV